MDKCKADKAMSDILGVITNRFPFYAFYTFDLKIVPVEGLGTLATDLEHLYYDPEFVVKTSSKDLLFIIIHEIVHCIFLHPGTFGVKRLGSRDVGRWKLASEYVANLEAATILKLDKRELPDGAYYDIKFDGKTTEEVYNMLPKDSTSKSLDITIVCVQDKQPSMRCGNCGHDLKPSDIPRPGKTSKCPHCGTDMHNNLHMLDVHIPQNNKEMIKDAVERVLAAASICKMQGTMPSGIARQLDRLRDAQVPWQRIVNRLVGQVLADDDYRWDKPNHRHPLSDRFVIPGLLSEKPSDLYIAVDTSGSIGPSELSAFASEMVKLHTLIDEMTIMTSDAKVHETVKVKSVGSFLHKLKWKGGGGTDFNPVFDTIQDLKVKPSLLVFFTDGMGMYPSQKPRYPILWVLTEQHQEPPWGYKTVINIEPEA